MLKINRILVPTDFSEFGDAALPTAESLARTHQAALVLLHALPDPRYNAFLDLHAFGDPAQVIEVLEHRSRLELASRAERLAVPADPRVIGGRGAPGDIIVSYAVETEARLIVMASHGGRGFRRSFVGSVSERVLRSSPCPVLVVRPQAGPPFGPQDYHTILVPVDFSWCSRLALTYARELAVVHDSSLVLLHVVAESTVPDAYGFGPGTIRVARRAAEYEAQRRLEELTKGSPAPERLRTLVRCGHPVVEILRCARELGADLILMGSHGRGGFVRLVLGSVTARVVHRAPCSVLVTGWGRHLIPGLRVLATHYPEVATGAGVE